MPHDELSKRDFKMVLAAVDDAGFKRRLRRETSPEWIRAAIQFEVERPYPTRQDRIAKMNQRLAKLS